MGLGAQISWQAQDFFVDLEVQISWQVQDFVGLGVQISWQARFRGRCRTLWPWSADFVAGAGVFDVEV